MEILRLFEWKFHFIGMIWLYYKYYFWRDFVHELQARKSGAEIMENTQNDISKFTIFHSVFQV